MKKLLALLLFSPLLAACGRDQPSSPAPEPPLLRTVVSSTPTQSMKPTGLLPYTSTPANTCGSYEWGHRVYLDEIPAFAVRQGPGCEYPVARNRLFKSDPIAFFDVLGKQGDWLLVDLCNDSQGWIFAPAINEVNIDVNLDELPDLSPPATPAGSRSPLVPLTESEAKKQAGETLENFFDLLQRRDYGKAVELFGGGYGNIIMWNPDVDPWDYPTLLQRACEWDDFQCFLSLSRIIKVEQLSPVEYRITVEFTNEDGSLYKRRSDPQDQDRFISQFPFRVVRDCNGRYLVVDWPFYPQWGG